jgi:hypothetical protein
MVKIIFAMMMLTMAACGGGAGAPGASTPGTVTPSIATGAGRIALKVTGAKSFNPNITPGQITQYVVTVSGEGFTPIQTTVAGDATEATIDGIPTGEHRMVHVAAVNPNGQKIREGEATDVAVPSDAVAEVPLAMQAVPIITNVADGAHLANTRLRFTLFSDPAALVELTAVTGEKSEALTDIVENRPTVATDAATGLANFVPPKLAPGEYLLTVHDSKTGRKSAVTVMITDGAKERGAPLVSGARQHGKSGVMQLGGFGKSLGMQFE